jgi:hypothetical protein
MNDNKDYFLNVTPEEFDAFKAELNRKNKAGAYRLVKLQKLSYRLTKAVLDTGKDSYGNALTPEEMEGMKLVLRQLVTNFETLKDEHEYTGKDQG